MAPIVTIGLCTRNSERTIRETITSIINQDISRRDMELIIVDGKSTDRTMEIIKEAIKSNDINVRFFEETSGLGFARQLIVNEAKGAYVVWVDGDVTLSRSYCSKQVAFMQANPSIGLATGRFGILRDDNWVATLENVGYVMETLKHNGRLTSKLIGAGGSICRLKAVKSVGGFNQAIKGAHEDMDLASRLRKAGWGLYTTKVYFYHRQRPDWKGLWKQQYWYGYGLHFSSHNSINLLNDKALDRVIISSLAYKLTYRKVVFFLPVHYVFKKTALLYGYLSAHMQGYGHK